jgi:hypothetical protein
VLEIDVLPPRASTSLRRILVRGRVRKGGYERRSVRTGLSRKTTSPERPNALMFFLPSGDYDTRADLVLSLPHEIVYRRRDAVAGPLRAR